MSPQWRALALTISQHLLDAHPGAGSLRLSVIERFRNLPAGAPRPEIGPPTLFIRIANGQMELHYGGEGDGDGDLLVDCEWVDAHHAACLTGTALADFNRWRMEQGRLAVSGSPAGAAALLHAVHDSMAPLTLPPETEPGPIGRASEGAKA